MGPEFWKPQVESHLKKCSEFVSPACDPIPTDGCCAVIPCTYCLIWTVYGEDDQFGSASFETDGWYGTIAGAAFRGYWERNYETDECEFVVTLDGEEIYRKSCYEGQSCRDSSDSVETTIYPDDGTLQWIKLEPRPLEYVIDEATNCRTHFCGNCECSCDCLCVTITSLGYVTTGEICDVSYPCDGPIWEGTVGDYELSLALDRDAYGECIIVPTINGYEHEPVEAIGCGGMVARIVVDADTTIDIVCQQCDCEAARPCCGLYGLTELTLVYTGISTGWGAGETIGERYTIWNVTLRASEGWITLAPNPYDPLDLYSVRVVDGGGENTDQCVYFETQSWWGGNWEYYWPVGDGTNLWTCPGNFGLSKQYSLVPPETNLDGYYTDIEITFA